MGLLQSSNGSYSALPPLGLAKKETTVESASSSQTWISSQVTCGYIMHTPPLRGRGYCGREGGGVGVTLTALGGVYSIHIAFGGCILRPDREMHSVVRPPPSSSFVGAGLTSLSLLRQHSWHCLEEKVCRGCSTLVGVVYNIPAPFVALLGHACKGRVQTADVV